MNFIENLSTRLIISFLLIVVFTSITHAGWTPPLQLSEDGVFYRPLIIAVGDTLHVVEDMAVPEDFIRYQRSLDGGISWSPSYLLPDSEVTTRSYNPSMAMKENNIYVSWRNLKSGGNYRQNIGFSMSPDAGSTWTPGIRVLDSNRDFIAAQTLGIMGDLVYIIFVHGTQQGHYHYIVDSHDNGLTWNEPREIFVGDDVGDIKTISLGDTIHVLWSGELAYPSPWHVYYMKSSDGGYSWSDNYNIRNTDSTGGDHPAITYNERGELIACWMDYRNSPYWTTGDILFRISSDGGDSWFDEVQVTDLHLSMQSSVIWAGDYLYLTYEDRRYGNREILFRKSSDNGQTWGEEERLSYEPDDTRDPCVAVSNEIIYVVWSRITSNPYSGGVYISWWKPEVSVEENGDDLITFDQELRAYPNPFNNTTVIEYKTKGPSELKIFNLLGQMVYYRELDSGNGSFIWSGNNLMGES